MEDGAVRAGRQSYVRSEVDRAGHGARPTIEPPGP